LRSVTFVAADILQCNKSVVQDLQKYKVITNSVGIFKVDEHIIKHIFLYIELLLLYPR